MMYAVKIFSCGMDNSPECHEDWYRRSGNIKVLPLQFKRL
jgi:hypothetical protein